MAKPLIPLVRSGGFYSSRRLTPLVYRGGFTRHGSEEHELVEKTVSGSVVSVTDALEMPAKSIIVAIEPVQAGSGDPSPENVRPITGWTGAEISHSGADTSDPDVISITFPSEAGTVYGGTVDLTNGVLTVDRVSKLLNDPTKWSTTSSNTVNFICYEDCSNRRKTAESFSGLICSYMSVNSSSLGNTARWVGATSNNFGIKSETLTIEQIKADAADGRIMICYPLATPITYDLTPQEIAMFRGANTLWADTGDTTLTYLADGN